MNERRTSLFLERQSYRRRRLVDVVRVLPLIGAVLWAVPLLWPSGTEDVVSTSNAIVYVFTVWLVMVVLGAVLARILSRAGLGEEQEDR
ncbi:hypothetical protein [Shimia abyssi]|uniref:Uncharacterized protein n=1 Tax=Shimia abyssi TaxID=1662395 RepID=A0A2P8FJ53_9RHOB|nr:hypothetical protein [Shimia abyssi]PSL21741.1 hypothetical protein CLV88_101165 [Shimia abyssi]